MVCAYKCSDCTSSVNHMNICAWLFFTEVDVEFTKGVYTTNETDPELEVCVRVASGQLGINITLQLEIVSGTAQGILQQAFDVLFAQDSVLGLKGISSLQYICCNTSAYMHTVFVNSFCREL